MLSLKPLTDVFCFNAMVGSRIPTLVCVKPGEFMVRITIAKMSRRVRRVFLVGGIFALVVFAPALVFILTKLGVC